MATRSEFGCGSTTSGGDRFLSLFLGWHKQTCVVTVFIVVEAHRKADRLILKSDKLNDAVIDSRAIELADDAGVVAHKVVLTLQQIGVSDSEGVRRPRVQHALPDAHLVCLQEPHVLSLSLEARTAAVQDVGAGSQWLDGAADSSWMK